MFRGLTAMAAICLVLMPILKYTYTNIMKTQKLIIVNTKKTSSQTSSRRVSSVFSLPVYVLLNWLWLLVMVFSFYQWLSTVFH